MNTHTSPEHTNVPFLSNETKQGIETGLMSVVLTDEGRVEQIDDKPSTMPWHHLIPNLRQHPKHADEILRILKDVIQGVHDAPNILNSAILEEAIIEMLKEQESQNGKPGMARVLLSAVLKKLNTGERHFDERLYHDTIVSTVEQFFNDPGRAKYYALDIGELTLDELQKYPSERQKIFAVLQNILTELGEYEERRDSEDARRQILEDVVNLLAGSKKPNDGYTLVTKRENSSPKNI